MKTRGIDAVIYTTHPFELFFQIKSSEEGRRKFLRKLHYDHTHITCIVVSPNYSDERIRDAIHTAILAMVLDRMQKRA